MMQLFIDYQLNDCTLSKMQTLRAKTKGNSGQKESLASNTVKALEISTQQLTHAQKERND